jgi:hypothetical protein
VPRSQKTYASDRDRASTTETAAGGVSLLGAGYVADVSHRGEFAGYIS